MKELVNLFENNAAWVTSRTAQDPQYFKNLSKDQDPRYLWIGCSDSRVPANEIIGLEPGELFVHRNVANVVSHTDINCLSVIEFALHILKVRHVIVCGHYGCGGVTAAMSNHHLGIADNWLQNIRDIYKIHQKEIDAIGNEKLRYARLVELSVFHQVMNVCSTTIVQDVWSRGDPVWIHGWVYDMESGFLHDLDCTRNG
jgi:carbonic anhydrase